VTLKRLKVMYFETVNSLPTKLGSTSLEMSEISEFARLHDTCKNKLVHQTNVSKFKRKSFHPQRKIILRN